MNIKISLNDVSLKHFLAYFVQDHCAIFCMNEFQKYWEGKSVSFSGPKFPATVQLHFEDRAVTDPSHKIEDIAWVFFL